MGYAEETEYSTQKLRPVCNLSIREAKAGGLPQV